MHVVRPAQNGENLTTQHNMDIRRRSDDEDLFNLPSSIYTLNSNKHGQSEKEAIKIETKTSAKKINIEWNINKQTIDIAKLSPKGEKKGVIGTSVQYDIHTFNLELCVPGWRRSQDGFSAFYLTVPRKKRRLRPLASNIDRDNNENENSNDYEENGSNDSNNNSNADANNNDDFVARYTICFGKNDNMLTRVSSIRNDFDLGVGFPNFTEITTLVNAVYENELIFKIHVEIFECESVIRKPSRCCKQQSPENIAAKLISKMYYDKLNCDAVVVVNYSNKHNAQRTKRIKVHKCVLTAASPVFHTFFKHKTKENATSSIFMNQWNVDIIMTMIKFLYLGKIELNHEKNDHDKCDADDGSVDEVDDDDEDEDEDVGLDYDGIGALSLTNASNEYDIEEETKSIDEEETIKSTDEETKSTEQEETQFTEQDQDEQTTKSSLSSLLKVKDKKILNNESIESNAYDNQNSNSSIHSDDVINELQFHCPENARKLFGLFQIAECYEIAELLIACCHKLRSYITMETCCIFLMYLDKYTHLSEIKDIKNFILEFIVQNIKSIKTSRGYLYLLQNKPRLLDELIDKITQNGL